MWKGQTYDASFDLDDSHHRGARKAESDPPLDCTASNTITAEDLKALHGYYCQ